MYVYVLGYTRVVGTKVPDAQVGFVTCENSSAILCVKWFLIRVSRATSSAP